MFADCPQDYVWIWAWEGGSTWCLGNMDLVLEWTPEEASLLQDRPFSAAALVYISREAWEARTFSGISELRTRGQETLYETCACVIHNSCIIIPLAI